MSTENPKVGFVSLGCPKALVDSERILTQLRTEGYEISPSYEGAGLVVVNTCGFIDAAKAESLQAIGEALQENGKVIVTGCMGADGDQILDAYPQVLSVSGPQQYEQVVSAVHEHLPPNKDHDPFIDLVPPQGIKLTPRHYSYLKISEGCNHRCTFCIIPALRGDLDSRPVGSVLDEAQRLVDAGVKELLVVSQDTSAYGVDQKYKLGFWQGRPTKTRLKELCQALGSLGVWVRLHYVYPYPSVDDVIPLMAEGAVVPYLDIPLQHAHPDVLKMMKRPAASEKTMERIKKWREICPEIVIRSTFIVGFPGETEEHFQYLLDFLKEARLDRVGCFTYSAVDGAPANALENPVPEDVKEARLARFMNVQAQISAEKLQDKVGQEMDILIDHAGPDGAIGRTKGDAPEIDGEVHLLDVTGLEPGQIVRGRIIEADDHDLWAELV
ncbi:30S ribosomal protein S12 methylthiotransferase RimO [Oceanospirillum maris]|uniref:30S ribosomal protein S12 methylthiotransferase RimO n=1 Tax=Oceanospirillum maris TaxID=64977 RepID=UPI00040DBBD7|nr:30S ribosomal protein S12 methylthiotransferase RimO [Oceanospirillum maris]